MTRVVINENHSVFLDGYRHILKYDVAEIIVKITKKKLIVQGINLAITSFCTTEMLIKGEITAIYFIKD